MSPYDSTDCSIGDDEDEQPAEATSISSSNSMQAHPSTAAPFELPTERTDSGSQQCCLAPLQNKQTKLRQQHVGGATVPTQLREHPDTISDPDMTVKLAQISQGLRSGGIILSS